MEAIRCGLCLKSCTLDGTHENLKGTETAPALLDWTTWGCV